MSIVLKPYDTAAGRRSATSHFYLADCLEVLAQVRHNRITVGIGNPHFSRKIILRHGIHRAPAFLSRAVVRRFGVFLMS